MASVSATDLNTKGGIVSDSMEDVVTVDNGDEIMSVFDSDDLTVGESDFGDELGNINDSEILGTTRYLNNGGDLGSTINSAASGDTIVLNGGTYNIWDFGISKSITIIGQNNPVISSKGHGDKCMFLTGAQVTFKNVSFQAESAKWGNVFYVYSGLLTVDECTFTGGYASKGGGSIRCCEGGACKILNSRFSGTSSGGDGGAIRIETTGEIINCTFENCKGSYGGAVQSEGSNNLKIINSTFKNCNAKAGGAVRIGGNSKQSLIDGCIFISNVASDDGGAISYYDSSSVDIANSYFEGNSAQWGGAVLFLKYSGAKLTNCTFKNNHASVDSGAVNGGALYDCTFIGNTADDFGGAASWGSYYNCVFIGNSAKNNGGAVKVQSANIWDCEFINNTVSNMGGAIFNDGGNLNINNCNFTNNRATSHGGAINAYTTSNLNILNCNFNDCYSINDCGGALHGDSVGILTLNGCNFENNHAGRIGGAIDLYKSTKFDVFNCNFTYCYANANDGGAVSLDTIPNVNIIGCNFDSCNATGFAGSLRILSSTGMVNISDSIFSNSYCSLEGGSVHCKEVNDLVIDNCEFLNSSSKLTGAAVVIWKASNANLSNLLFKDSDSGNYAGSVYLNDVTKFNLCDSEFINSHATMNGGAIHVNPAGELIITGCTFDNCSANRGNALDLAFTENIFIDRCNFTKVNYNNQEAIRFTACDKYDVLDSIFEVAPKDITYHYTTKLAANNLSIVKGDDGVISAKLSNVYGPLSNKQVVFTVNGNKYPRTTLSDGVATFSVKDVVTDLGRHKIEVSFDGDGIYDAVSQTVDVMINMYKATLTVTQSVRDYYGEKSLTFKLVDSKTGAAKSDVPIHAIIYLGEEIYKTADISTSSNGEVIYSMAAFEPGTYKVKAYVTTANVDVNVIELDDIVVSKISGVIELSKSNSNKTLTIKLVNPANGDVYRGIGVKLQFSPNGQVANVVTDSNGEFNYPIQFDPGTYHVLASVDSSGFKEFANAELSNIVISTAGKDDSVIKFSNEIVFDYLKSGSTTVTLEGCSVSREGCSVDNHPEASIVVKDNKITVSGLKAGPYTLRVTSTPDVYHNPVTRTVKITVNKIDSSLTINKAVSFNYGDTGITTVTVNGGSIVKSGVSVEGHSEAIISVVNNEIYVSNLTVGTYTLKVTTSPDSDHNAVNRTTTVTVKKINSIIDFEYPISFVYGGVGSVPLTLEGCEVVREGCSVDNHPEAIINIDKNNVISVSNLSVGSYTLRISSIPDSNHNADTQTIVVTVTKADSDVGISPKSITFDYGGVGSANLDLDGCSVLSDDVSVVGHSEAITRVVNNVVYVSNLTANTYTLQIKTTPDGNHKSVTKKFSVTVNKPLSTVGFRNPVVFDYLGEGTTTLDLNGCTVDLDKISVVGHDEAVISKNNKGVITVSNLTAGSYTLKVVTDPDANHRANTATVAITVNKLDSKVIFTKEYISFKYAESGSTPISLENCKVASMSIVGHDDVKPVRDDDEITVSGLPVGNYVMKVTTDPDDNYNSVDAYINVTVVKNTATITVKKSQTVAYKKSTNWAITLKDSSGKPVSGVKVNLKIYKGNKLYKNVNNLKVTDANGITNYNTNGLPVGTYKFVVSVSHAGYNVKSVSTPVKVIKQTAVKIILNTKSDKKGAVISIIVKDKAGKKYLNNIKLTLSIKNGKTYNTVTLITGNYKSGKGVSAYSTNMLTVGSHNVKVETADIKYSGSASKNVKVLASAKKYRNWWEKISKGKKTSYGT